MGNRATADAIPLPPFAELQYLDLSHNPVGIIFSELECVLGIVICID
jgi:hypothetical protein